MEFSPYFELLCLPVKLLSQSAYAGAMVLMSGEGGGEEEEGKYLLDTVCVYSYSLRGRVSESKWMLNMPQRRAGKRG